MTGYLVRVAKTPIAAPADFNAARDIPYTGSGTCPASGCTVLVNGCYIENGYYFAVAAVDYVGNVGTFVATSTATTAHFIQTVLTSTLANQRFGKVIDGSGDLNGDGFADLVVTHGEGKDIYLYFGSASGLSTSPLDIQGTSQYFGYSAAVIGDINGDGKEDLAIGSPIEGDGAVYVYYGRTTWAVPLVPDVTVTVNSSSSGDPKFANALFGWSLSRLGDFNGDGVDDFAIGNPYYNSQSGTVAVILGKTGGLPSSITLPSAYGTNAIRIDGTSSSYLGWSTVGLGHFYGSGGSTSLLAGAPGSGSTGAILAFAGITGVPSSIDQSTRNSYVAGTSNYYLGSFGLFALGNLGPTGQLAVGIPTPYLAAPGQVQLLSGTAAGGPFAQTVAVTSAVSGAAATFGQLVIGSGYSGRDGVGSFIGDTRSDLVVGSRAGGTPQILIIDGSTISFPSSLPAQTAAQVQVNLPTTWTDFSNYSSPVADLDKDGYADIAVGQTDYTGTPTNGGVIVLR